MKSPNGQFEAICTDFQEVRMGSPLFGKIELKETNLQLEGREFGEAMAFSRDSRFFAANQLRIAKGNPHFKVVVFDLLNETEITVDSGDGLVRKISWDDQNRVEITAWTHTEGEKTKVKNITEESFPERPKLKSIWSRIFG